jgi:hypothetical protein
MAIGVLVAGIGLVLAGLLAIGFGVPVKEFSFGNTLMLIGALGVCSGAIMIALWMAIRELKIIGRRLGAGMPEPRGEITVRAVLPPGAVREEAPADSGALFGQPAIPSPGGSQPPQPPPWQDEAAGDHAPEPEPAVEAAAPQKPKRNLLFSSTSRKERERAQSRTSEPLPPDLLSADLRPNPADAPQAAVAPSEPPPASFDDAWPKPERGRAGDIPPQPRGPQRPPPAPRANGAPAPSGDQPAVTVLKSGVVDGMAYSLYSDGSIEAQMPEGMMRFASIDELRAHLDQRP